MDRIYSNVLEKICSLAPLGRYVVISEDEFWEVFPEEAERNETELRKALKSLISEGYIDMKYSGGDMYCVAPLKNYEKEPEEPLEEIFEPVEPERQPKAELKAFFAAFFGGALGSLIISLIFALI